MAVLTLTAAAAPVAVAGAGLTVGANSNGTNSAAWTFSGGAPGAGDTIANAELLKGVSADSRLYAFLSKSFATQAELDGTVAALRIMSSGNSASSLRFVTAAPGVPTATVTTAASTGALSVSLAYSASA